MINVTRPGNGEHLEVKENKYRAWLEVEILADEAWAGI